MIFYVNMPMVFVWADFHSMGKSMGRSMGRHCYPFIRAIPK